MGFQGSEGPHHRRRDAQEADRRFSAPNCNLGLMLVGWVAAGGALRGPKKVARLSPRLTAKAFYKAANSARAAFRGARFASASFQSVRKAS